jgi:hypothetical protein
MWGNLHQMTMFVLRSGAGALKVSEVAQEVGAETPRRLKGARFGVQPDVQPVSGGVKLMFDAHPSSTTRGAGLARGPALIVGMVLAVFGLMLFFRVSGTPLSTTGFPDAVAIGERFLGFEANAWTAWLTVAAGVLLLFGAAQHLAAKAMSLIVGLGLGAASVIALVDGDDVLGLAAANGLTALGWGIAAAVLLANTLLPRLRGRDEVRHQRDTDLGPTAEQRADARPQPVRTPADSDRPTVVTGERASTGHDLPSPSAGALSDCEPTMPRSLATREDDRPPPAPERPTQRPSRSQPATAPFSDRNDTQRRTDHDRNTLPT